jgi:hypothetical protein
VLVITEFDENKKIKQEYFNKLEGSVTTSNIYNNKTKKTYNKNINQLSYNKKDLVLNTWSKIKPYNDTVESDTESDKYTIIDYSSASDSEDEKY